MRRAGVIGYPLGHSLSPAIVQAAFDAAGIEARYELWATPPEALEERIASLRADDVLGANVTIPHKQAVVPLLDSQDDLAARVGAVNTIVNRGSRLFGHNTDVAGFARALSADGGFDARGARVAVLGAGGAGRAVGVALLEAGAGEIYLADIVAERSEAVASALRGLAPAGTTVAWSHWGDDAFRRAVAGCQLLVNCTPVGMLHGSAEPSSRAQAEGQSPIPAEAIPSGILVFDLVYNPPETPLLRAAGERGSRGVSGLGMLVYQAAESFRLWTGRKAPVADMLQAGRAVLEAVAGQGAR